MMSEYKRELIDRFTNNERYIFARSQISSSKVQLKKRRRKNFQNQTKFNVDSHDERKCHSENVLIEKDESLSKLNDEQMTTSKNF
jgi:hypothetical protein